jgi:hypothetical protein
MHLPNQEEKPVPARVIDFEAIWSSTKLSRCTLTARADYVWLYGLADCYGVFEMPSIRVILFKVSPIRDDLTEERLASDFAEYVKHGLLFCFTQGGKRFGFWTKSDKPGRLPGEFMRKKKHFYSLGVTVPKDALAAYLNSLESGQGPTDVATTAQYGGLPVATSSQQGGSNVADGMGNGMGDGKGMVGHKRPPAADECVSAAHTRREGPPESSRQPTLIPGSKLEPEDLATIWNDECGVLPHVRLPLTPKRQKRLATLVRSPHFSVENFRLVVSRARTAPFLRGEGKNGWRANLDWICDPDKFLQILEGQFDEHKATTSDRVGRMVEDLRGGNKAMQ